MKARRGVAADPDTDDKRGTNLMGPGVTVDGMGCRYQSFMQ